jgi:hypothetical protein
MEERGSYGALPLLLCFASPSVSLSLCLSVSSVLPFHLLSDLVLFYVELLLRLIFGNFFSEKWSGNGSGC